jgi:hypothetical protein
MEGQFILLPITFSEKYRNLFYSDDVLGSVSNLEESFLFVGGSILNVKWKWPFVDFKEVELLHI